MQLTGTYLPKMPSHLCPEGGRPTGRRMGEAAEFAEDAPVRRITSAQDALEDTPGVTVWESAVDTPGGEIAADALTPGLEALELAAAVTERVRGRCGVGSGGADAAGMA